MFNAIQKYHLHPLNNSEKTVVFYIQVIMIIVLFALHFSEMLPVSPDNPFLTPERYIIFYVIHYDWGSRFLRKSTYTTTEHPFCCFDFEWFGLLQNSKIATQLIKLTNAHTIVYTSCCQL